MAIVILRLQDGLNYSHILEDGIKDVDIDCTTKDQSLNKTMTSHRESNESLVQNYAQMSQGLLISFIKIKCILIILYYYFSE
jgi:hypothetical protein